MEHATSYDDDIYAWAHEQAAVLRRLAETRRDLPNELDIENLCEEIEGVARSELGKAESFLRLLLLHLLKAVSAPDARAVQHWRTEARVFQADFQDAATRSILRKIRVDLMWRLAHDQAEAQLALEGDAILGGLPAELPLHLDDLAAPTFDIDSALDRLRRSAAHPSA